MGGKQSKEQKRVYYLKNREAILSRQKTNICIDCMCKIDKRAKRCFPCSKKKLRKFPRDFEIGEPIKKCSCGCGKFIYFKRRMRNNMVPNYLGGHRPSPRKGKGKIYNPRKCSYCGNELNLKQLRARLNCCSDKCRLNSLSNNGKRNRIKQIFPIKDTSIELKIQALLSALHIEYITHKYIFEINHKYQCDILIPVQKGINQKTIIECDGCYWHGCPICSFKEHKKVREQKIRDKLRTKELIQEGYNVIRLWEHEIKKINLEKIKYSGGKTELLNNNISVQLVL